MKLTRLTTLYIVAVICLAFGLLAAAPLQTREPPAPISLVDQIVSVLVTALIGAVGWLLNEVRKLKAQGQLFVRKITPDDWEWVLEDEAAILVKAAAQQFPADETGNMLKYVQGIMYATLERNGVTVSQYHKDKIRAAIEAAVFDLYAEFEKPPTFSASDHN
jgi:hypothetical protein